MIVTDLRIAEDYENFEYDAKMDLIFAGVVGHGDIGQAAALAWWGARKRRGIILAAENPPKNPHLEPIENEPLFANRKRASRNWSNRFSLEYT